MSSHQQTQILHLAPLKPNDVSSITAQIRLARSLINARVVDPLSPQSETYYDVASAPEFFRSMSNSAETNSTFGEDSVENGRTLGDARRSGDCFGV